MALTQETCKKIQLEIVEFTKKLEQKYNIKFTKNDITWSPVRIGFRIEAVSNDSKEQNNKYAPILAMLGLKKDLIGQEFVNRGNVFRVIEVHKNRPKFPITAVCVKTNDLYKFPIRPDFIA
jgi:uncharacterized protein YlxP (DUF503 family)